MKEIIKNSFLKYYPTFHKLVVFVAISFITSELFFVAKFEIVQTFLIILDNLERNSILKIL